MPMKQLIPNSPNFPAAFYTVKEVASLLKVSDKSIRRAIARSLFQPSKAFRKLLIPREQVETFYERTK